MATRWWEPSGLRLVDVGLLGHAGLVPFTLRIAVHWAVPEQGATATLLLFERGASDL